jgi:hypothetical protein
MIKVFISTSDADRVAGDPSPFEYAEAEAMTEFAAGASGAALAALERLDSPAPWRCLPCVYFDLGLVRDASDDRDGAIADYERYVTTDWDSKLFPGHYAIPHALERLGQLYDARARESAPPSPDDIARAAEYYGRFVELWAEADEELQPRVRAAQARLEGILRERG